MPKIVEVPGVGNVEFPDDVPDQDISRTIRLHTPEPDAKGSPEWAQWRNQRVSDLNGAAAKPPDDPGFFHGLWQAVNPFPAAAQLIEGKNPDTGKYGGPIQGVMNLAGNAVDAAKDQVQKARDAWARGEHVEAAGHALAAALPIAGPVAANAGEAIGGGRPGEGIGQAVGLGLSLEAPRAISSLPAAFDAVAPAAVRQSLQNALRDSSVAQYSRALAQTTKANKAITAEVVPRLIDEGVTAGSLKGLAAKTAAQIGSYGRAIGEAWDNLPPGTTTEFQPIYDRLQSEIDNTHSIKDASGKPIPAGPEAERAIGNITKLQQTLTDVAETDPQTGRLVLPVEKARFLRQYFDKVAEAAGRSGGGNLAADSAAQAHAIAADSIRGELAKDHPDIADLNKEYSFWKDVNQVVTDTIARKQGQAPSLGARAAQAAGFVKGGVLGAQAAKALTEATASPAWRTVDAVLKDRLADALAKGQRGPAEFYVSKAAAALAAGSPALTAGSGSQP